MNVEALLLANRAESDGALVSLSGGGWEHYGPVVFPATISGWLVGIIAVEPGDADASGSLTLGFDVSRDGGPAVSVGSMAVSEIRPETASGVPHRVTFAFPFLFVAEAPGVVTAHLRNSDGGEISARSFEIRAAVPDAPPADL